MSCFTFMSCFIFGGGIRLYLMVGVFINRRLYLMVGVFINRRVNVYIGIVSSLNSCHTLFHIKLIYSIYLYNANNVI